MPLQSIRLGGVIITILIAGGLLASVTTPASSAYQERGGYAYDREGDGPVPQRDLVWVEANNDPNEGRFWGYVEFAAKPTAARVAEYRVYYGKWDATRDECVSDVNISGRTARGGAAQSAAQVAVSRAVSKDAVSLGSGRAPARAEAKAKQVNFTVTSARAKGKQFDCVFARLVPVGAAADVPASRWYDGTDADDLTRNGPPELFATNATVRVKAKKWAVARFTVSNQGSSTARKVRARVTKVPNGMAVKRRVVTVKKIRPGGKVKASIRVRKAGPGTRTLRVRLTSPGSAPEMTSVSVQVSPKPPKRTRSLVGQYFWTTRISFGRGWDTDGIHFVNKRFAYRGLPPKGIPNCRKRTASATGDGCVPYWFNAKRNILQVDNERGRRIKGGFKFGGDTYVMRLRKPKPGSRLRVNLIHVDSMFCPGPGCTTWFTSFETWKNGRYRLNDARGRYRILPRGRVRLTSGGQSEIRTLTLMTNNKGKPVPAKKGVFLGGTNYYRG